MTLMVVTTERAFAQIFARLSVQLRNPHADSVACASYFAVLRDLPAAVLTRSAERIASERGRKFFPTTGEWRDVALRVQQDMLREELGTERDWKVECTGCEDSGWRTGLQCDGEERGACGRPRRHLPHDYAVPCACRDTNRTYRRHHQLDEQRA